MDKAKNPGISLDLVQLLECEVGKVDLDAKLAFSLEIVSLEKMYSPDNKLLRVAIKFDLMSGIEKPPCHFKCSYLMTYSRPENANMPWDEFKDHIVVAHLIPYIREFISNITGRMQVSTLMLPPLNAFHLIKKFQTNSELASRKETVDPGALPAPA